MTYSEKIRLYKRIHTLHRTIIAFSVVIIIMLALVVAGILLIIGNQAQIMIQQTDTLNQIMEIRMEAPVVETVPEEPTAAYPLTSDEFDLVCRVVSAEARGEDFIGQEAVAQVIRDRALTWEMTVTEVVMAEGQFAKPYTGEISDSIKLAVSNVFDGGVSVLEVPTTHFYSGPEPYWAAGKVNRGRIGCHWFLY